MANADFSRNRKWRRGECKLCYAATSRTYYKRDIKRQRARALAYAKKNPDKMKARKRRWYKRHAKKDRARQLRYHAANRQKQLLRFKKYYLRRTGKIGS